MRTIGFRMQSYLHKRRNRGHWGHVPPRFCNKQRCALFLFRECPLFVKENGALEVSCPPSLRCFLRPWLSHHICAEKLSFCFKLCFIYLKKSTDQLLCYVRKYGPMVCRCKVVCIGLLLSRPPLKFNDEIFFLDLLR